ncbi:MAG: isoprenylcysteine carboxylmethyltransferase family protein [Pseudomonadota bacterium]
MFTRAPFDRLWALLQRAIAPPPGAGRIALALVYGAVCHLVFAAAISAMIYAMFFGLSQGLGRVDWPLATFANLALLLQFPLLHSALLSARGRAILSKLGPKPHGATLATTTYAIIASLQLLALFVFWTPSGIIWFEAEGWLFWIICAAYATSWLLLALSIYEAGVELQSGALGWLSLLAKVKPVFPDMPTGGIFRLIRQPIYVAFALTLWTVPVWTPDQLALAVTWTAYCLIAPILKERRFAKIYGARFRAYQARVPYALPRLGRVAEPKAAQTTGHSADG